MKKKFSFAVISFVLIFIVTSGFAPFSFFRGIESPIFMENTFLYGTQPGSQGLTPESVGSVSVVSTYTFAQSTTTYTPAYGGTLLCNTSCDDQSYAVTLPFTFTYSGVAYTSLAVSNNGYVAMGLSAVSGYTPICTGSYFNIIAPFAYDLMGNVASGDSLRYLTTGSSPNRVFTIEWSKWGLYNSGSPYNELDFQIKFFETTNVIQFVYKPETPTISMTTMTCGLSGASTADYNLRTNTTSWTTNTAGTSNCAYMSFSSTNYPTSGLTFTWTPGVPSGPPTVVTTTPTAAGPNSGTSGGNVTDGGSSSVTARGVCWNTAGSPTISDLHTSDGTGTGTFASSITGLTGGTLYHVRAYATNTSGTSYGSDLTFTTCTGSISIPYNDGFETAVPSAFPCGWLASGVVATYNAPSTYNRMPHTGTNYAAFQYGTVTKWAITQGIPLTGGQTYNFSMWYITDGLAGWTNLMASYNSVQSATGMTPITGATVSNPTNSTYVQMTGTFTPATTGTYYIGVSEYDTGGPWYLSIDDISVFVPSNMSYVSSTTTQNTLGVPPNSTNNQIIGMQVVTTGNLTPFSISQFKLTTTGSTNPSNDIRNAKVFYTGNNAVFGTTTQYGTTVTNPNGTFYVVGSQVLSPGTNYFWLTYDIPSTATTLDLVDATCDSISGTGTMGTVQPIPPNPPGSRQIVGPMAGNYTIGNGMTYPNFNLAIQDLSVRGVSGPVTFLVKPGIFGTDVGTEIDSNVIVSTGTVPGVSSTNTVTFKKKSDEVGDVWVERRGTTGTTDYIIGLIGAKYTTFDSINVRQKDTATAYNMVDWGYYINNPTVNVGCQNNTIRNCQIYLKNTNSATIGIRQYYTAIPSLFAGTNSNNTYANNTIVNAYQGIYVYGYSAPSPYNLFDQNTTITGNNILNLGGTVLAYAYGIYTNYQGNGLKILNNTISSAPYHLYYFEGIYDYYGYDANKDINGNTINANYNANYACYGVYTYYSGALSSPTVTNHVNINNNIFNFKLGSTFSSTVYGIYTYYSYADTLNINGNVFANDSIPGTGTFYGIYPYYWGNVLNVKNNSITNLSRISSGATYPFYIYAANLTYAKAFVGNNTLSGMRSASGANYGIYLYPGATCNSYVFNNTISNNFTNTGTTLYGIYNSNTLNAYIYNNKIDNLKDSTYTAASIYGIYAAGSTNSYYYNNFISNLKAPASSSNPSIVGLYVTSGIFNGLYNNSIYLADTSTSTSYGSAGVYLYNSYPIDMRNNNIVNISKPGNLAFANKTVGLRLYASTYLTNLQSTSNNNNIYVGSVADTGRVIYFDASNRDFTLQSYKNRVSPREQSAVSELPPFVNAPAGDLHLSTSTATLLNNGGYLVSNPISVATDIDNNSRSNPFCDIGAHEFAGTSATDIVPPTITYTPLGVGTTANRTLSGVTITDPSGVYGTAAIWYKKSTNANTFNDNTSATDGWKYSTGTVSGSSVNLTIDYTKIFGGSVIAGDIIQYFVNAQDNAGTPNVGINAGAYATQPTNIALVPANFPITGTINQYTIGTGGLSNTVYVGAGQTYTSLTGAAPTGLFAAINTGVLTGNLNVVITSDLFEVGTNQLQNWAEQTVPATYKITIKPDGTTIRNIFGWVSNGMIRLYGVNNVTFDGSFGGSGRYLRFNNRTVSSYPTFQFTGGCTYDTLKNCILEGNVLSTTSGVVLIGVGITTNPIQANNFITISGNLISSRTDSLITTATYNGICNYGSAVPVLNNNNQIVNNEIKNFLYYGIYLPATGTGDSWVIKKNSLYYLQDAFTPAYVGVTMYGIYAVPGVYGSGYTIDSNYIGGSQALAGGSYMNIQGLFNGIYTSLGFKSVSTIRGNVIKNIRSTYLTANTTTFYMIGGTAGWENISGNTIGSADTTQRLQLNGSIRCIYGASSFFTGPATVTVNNNYINNIWTRPDSTIATITGTMYRYAMVVGGYLPVDCSNNTIMNVLSWQSPGATAYNCFHMGILPNVYSATTVRNNYISNIANLSTAAPTSTGRILIYGMQPIAMGEGSVFSGNKISHIYSSTIGGTGDLIMGIYNAASYYGSTVTLSNNQITLLDNAGVYANIMGAIDVSGSYAGGVCNWYDNSIVLGGTSGTGTPYNSYAYYKSTTVGIACASNLRNNVLYNFRTGGNNNHLATGTASGTKVNEKFPLAFNDENEKPVMYPPKTVGSTTFTSDYNFFVAPSSSLIGDWYGTLGNMTSWQTNSNGDFNSVSDTVANITAANLFRNYTNADLNIDTTKYGASYVYKNGIGLAGITNDFNGYPRATSGPVNIGSHEFSLNGNTRVNLILPGNNSVGATRPVSMVWSKGLFATGYRIQIASDSLFTSVIINTNVTDTTYSFATAFAATNYWWKVNPVYTGVNGLYSSTFKFSTIQNLPNAPVLVFPANNATGQPYPSLTYIWNKAVETITLTKSSNISKNEIGKLGPKTIAKYWFDQVTDTTALTGLLRDSTLTDTTKAVTTLAQNISYYWRVRAKNEAGWGPFSGWFKFTTATDPTALSQANFNAVILPQIMSCGNATRLPVVYRATLINLVPNKLYRFYNGGAAFTDLGTTAYGAGNPLFVNPDSTKNRYTTSSGLTTAGGYDQFRANGSGQFTGWFCYVNTGNARFAAGKYSIPSIVLGDSLGVLVARYALNDSIKIVNFSSNVADTCATGIYGVSVAFPRNIVSLYDNVGGTGKPLAQTFLEYDSLTVASIVPFYTTYVETMNGRWGTVIPNVNANGVRRVEQRSLATGVSMTFNTDADGTWPSGAITINPTGGLTAVGLLINDAPLLNAPVLSTPANGSVDLSVTPTFTWTAVTYASAYRFQVSLDSLFGSPLWDTSGISVLTVTIPAGKLTTNTKYYWRVDAATTIGQGPFSSIWNFMTIPNAPNAPVLVSPANGATGQPVNLTFVWRKAIETLNLSFKNKSKGIEFTPTKINNDLAPTSKNQNIMVNDGLTLSKYWIEYSIDSTFATGVIRDSSLTDTTKSVTGLSGNTKYWWRVKAKNQFGWGSFSTAWNFTTLALGLPLNLKVYLEGFWDGSVQVADTAKIYLAAGTSPYAFVDSMTVVLGTAGTANPTFTHATSGNYYISVVHRNHLETWSANPVTFTAGTPVNYDFTTASTQAYGGNMKQVGSVWVLYGGDANADGSIDASDIPIFLAQFGMIGYLSADFNGDNSVDASDIPIFLSNFGLIKLVPGADPLLPEILKGRKLELNNIMKTLNTKVKTNNKNN